MHRIKFYNVNNYVFEANLYTFLQTNSDFVRLKYLFQGQK